jgi:hypothetical protein
MKDFDQERRERNAEREARITDRTFVLGGVEFTFRPTSSYTVLALVASTNEMDAADTIRAFEDAICEFLVEGEAEKFLEVARNKDDPITFQDLNDICFYITEKQSGRPTLAPSPSTTGQERTTTPSTDDSSSKPAAVSAA